MKLPSGQRHCLILSGDADAKLYLLNEEKWFEYLVSITDTDSNLFIYSYNVGCSTKLRTLFLWLVSVHTLFPAAKSQRRMVESWLPVMICGSAACETTLAMVLVWPTRV